MKTNPISQHSVAVALVQLLEEHPELSEFLSWSICRSKPHLLGFIHDGGTRALGVCAGILGGSVEVGAPYSRGVGVVRQYSVTTVWRDVPVEIAVVLPVAAEAVAA